MTTMIIAPKELLKLVKKDKLVENLSERELTNPEGTGFDLRLGEVFKISGKAFLGETHRQTPDIESIKVWDDPHKNFLGSKRIPKKAAFQEELSALLHPLIHQLTPRTPRRLIDPGAFAQAR